MLLLVFYAVRAGQPAFKGKVTHFKLKMKAIGFRI